MEGKYIYELLFRRENPKEDFVYDDFVRTSDNISEQKHQIRRNIIEYGMDKKVEELLREYLKKAYIPRGKCHDAICVKVEWNEDEKEVTLLQVAYYD